MNRNKIFFHIFLLFSCILSISCGLINYLRERDIRKQHDFGENETQETEMANLRKTAEVMVATIMPPSQNISSAPPGNNGGEPATLQGEESAADQFWVTNVDLNLVYECSENIFADLCVDITTNGAGTVMLVWDSEVNKDLWAEDHFSLVFDKADTKTNCVGVADPCFFGVDSFGVKLYVEHPNQEWFGPIDIPDFRQPCPGDPFDLDGWVDGVCQWR